MFNVEHGDTIDANDIKNVNGTGPGTFPLQSKKFFPNRSGEYYILDAKGNSYIKYLEKGKSYDIKAIHVANNSTVGTSTTEFTVTEIVAGVTYRYTYTTNGTDPGITAATFPKGIDVVINGANFSAGNNGTFPITLSADNYFEVTNPNGVAEANKVLGAGTLIPRSIPLLKHLDIKF